MRQPPSSDDLQAAGRGVLEIAGAKIYFIIAGFIVQFSLPRLFGAPEVFGLFSVAVSGVSILNNVLIAATIQSVSKFTSEDEAAAPSTLRQALALQGVLGLAIYASIFVGAAPLARFMRDDTLVPLLRIAGLVTLSYAVYAAVIGYLNGLRRFGQQARFDATFTTLRSIGMLSGAALGFGALGAVAGFAAAAVTIALASLVTVGLGARGGARSAGVWFAFMAPIWAYQGTLNGMLQLDLWVLKKTAAELALAAGASGAAELADGLAGLYRGAQTFAFVPYQLVLAITFVIFPTVSRATALGDAAAARAAVQGSMRFSTLALLAMAAPIAGGGAGLLRFAYGPAYGAGAPALDVLAFGLVAFTLFVVAATALSGGGMPRIAAGTGAVGAAVSVVAAWSLLRLVGLGPHALTAVAAGTSLGMSVALLTAGAAVYRRFGAFIAPKTAARALVAAALAFAVTRFVLPSGPLYATLLAPVLGFVAYVVALALTGEIGRAELALLARVLKRAK